MRESSVALDALAHEVGLLAINAGRLEHLLQRFVATLIRGDQVAAIVAASGLFTRDLVRIGQAVARVSIRDARWDLRERVSSALEVASKLYEERNAIIHAGWIEKTEHEAFRFRLRTGGKITTEDVALDTIRSLAARHAALAHELVSLSEALQEEGFAGIDDKLA